MNKISTNPVYRFGEFTLDTGRAALFLGDEELRLRRRTFEVLTYLVRNSGRLVSKEELFEGVWGDVAVTDDSLVQCLVEIRKALGDEQDRVRTIRGRGYLFEGAMDDAPARVISEEPVPESAGPAAWPPGTVLLLVLILRGGPRRRGVARLAQPHRRGRFNPGGSALHAHLGR